MAPRYERPGAVAGEPRDRTLGTMRRFVLVAVAAFAMVACSNDRVDPVVVARDVTGITTPPDSVADVSSSGPLDYTIEWTPLDDRVDEGRITVPVDYADPQGDTIDLYVARHRASNESVGPMLANRGGPGAEGASLALNASGYFEPDITDNFEIIGWDPRGTGQSEGVVDCIDDAEYDRFYANLDVTPDDETERAAIVETAEEFAQRCIDRVEHVQYVGTNNSARDMDAIRQALGVDQISYFGFSYGSELGGVWTTLFPTTVRARCSTVRAIPTPIRSRRAANRVPASRRSSIRSSPSAAPTRHVPSTTTAMPQGHTTA